jgi:hypothetical protein
MGLCLRHGRARASWRAIALVAAEDPLRSPYSPAFGLQLAESDKRPNIDMDRVLPGLSSEKNDKELPF